MRWPVAIVAVLALLIVSVACAMSCVSTQTAATPPCHHHKSSTSCAPLLLTGELSQATAAATVVAVIAILPITALDATVSELAAATPTIELSPPLPQSSVLRI